MKDFFSKILEFIKKLFNNNTNNDIVQDINDDEVVCVAISTDNVVENEIVPINNLIKNEEIMIKTNDITVILDAGHGINTPGKRSPILDDGRQLFEWKFNRELSIKLKNALENRGIRCIQANVGEEDPQLSKRAAHINEIYDCEKKNGRKCIMISLHGNAAGNGDWYSARGWEVWSTVGTTKSDDLAQCFVHCFHDVMPNMKLRGHKEKDFTVIKKTNCPCVLTENFFYDNIEDCKFMLSEEGKNKIVELHVRAILDYFDKQ